MLSWLQALVGNRTHQGRLLERRVANGGADPARALGLESRPPGLALLCESSPGGSLGFVRQCLLARLELDSLDLPGYGSGVGVGAHWTSEPNGLDFSFGLGWLDPAQPQRLALPQSGLTQGANLGQLGALGLNLPLPLSASLSVQLDGTSNIGSDGWLSLGVQQLRGRNETVNLLGQLVPVFESDALRLEGGVGAFSGALTGRVFELQGVPGSLNSIDLGVSWRTPWRGEFTVGTTRYWSSGDTSQWPLRELPSVVDEAGGRVPYVRYHQDL